MKTKTKLTFLFILLFTASFGQISSYTYKRELSGIKDSWHKVVLPTEIFEKISPDLSDVRIFGITDQNDTIEAPYILQIASEKVTREDVNLDMINNSKNNKGFYYTFEVLAEDAINQIDLDFLQQNFDWRLSLEGSHNQQEWFSIVNDYRILSISNEMTDFQFTKVSFPSSKYRYYRMLIDNNRRPELLTAKLSLNETTEGRYIKYPVNSLKVNADKQSQQTIIYADLNANVPVSRLKIYVKDKIDYYRHMTVEYLSDSVKTPKGWKYNYTELTTGTLNSIEKDFIMFNSTILKKLRIVIENNDNEPLNIDSLSVKGYEYELLVRFNDPATYYLTYGNKSASAPVYDINNFASKIPENMTSLALGNEQQIQKEAENTVTPLFQNKLWLWVVMGVIILVLGVFSFRMIAKK